MADELLGEDAFNNEQSQKLFEVIDELHTCGAKAYVDIPEIIIVGDQSAGKSSLLQSLTDIPFPVAGRLCTRFPTRIVSRRTPKGSDVTRISIEAAASLGYFPAVSVAEREQKYANFRPSGDNLSEDGFKAAVDDAMRFMGITADPDTVPESKDTDKRPNFSSDVLRIELSGPNRSHFSILDVPGVIQSRTGDVTSQEMEGVRNLVVAEMRRKQSIIVCVASGNNDLANQAIFDMASKEDPRGERTLGVLTKCDQTQHAEEVVRLAQNDREGDIYFENGWFVARNRTPPEALERISSTERHRREEELFSYSPWNKLPPSRRGVQALKKHLGDLLCLRMRAAFPQMLADIQDRKRSTILVLDSLGQARSSIEQKRTYLTRIAQRFHGTALAVLRGRYESIKGDNLKLRKQIRDANDSFMQNLKSTGHRVPFGPIPDLQHLHRATTSSVQNGAEASGSSPFASSKTANPPIQGSNGLSFGNPGPLTVSSQVPQTVGVNFQPRTFFVDSESALSYIHNLQFIPPFTGFSFEELRLRDYVQSLSNASTNADNVGNTFGKTSNSGGLFGSLGSSNTNNINSSNLFGPSNPSNGTQAGFGGFGGFGAAQTTQTQSSDRPSFSSFGSARTVPTQQPQKPGVSIFGAASTSQNHSPKNPARSPVPTQANIDEHNAEIYRWIREEIQANRGTELQGTLNPDVMPMLFHQQAYKWGEIAEKHFLDVERSTVLVLNGILDNLNCDQITKKKIWPRVLEAGNTGEAEKLQALRERFDNIRSRHLQTSNVAFEEKVAQARYLRFQAALDRYRVSKQTSQSLFASQVTGSELQFVVDMRDTAALFSELHMSNSRNLENEIHDTLKAYYEIARDDFIEYVTQHIVENFVNSDSGPVLMFSPLYVASLSDKDIEDVAKEDESVVRERVEKEAALKRLKHAERIALRYA